MRKTILAALLALAFLIALSVIPSALATGAGCIHPVSGPWTTSCLHWPDGNRSQPIGRILSPLWYVGNAYTSSIARANNVWAQAGFTKVGLNTDSPQGTSDCAIRANTATYCAQDFTETCGQPPNMWVGCTNDWVYTEWYAPTGSYQMSPHIYGSVVKFDIGGLTDGNGNPFYLTGNRRDVVACHETGHVYGLDHPGGLQPGIDSCLHRYLVENGDDVANIPNATVAGQAQANHNHVDSSYQNFWPLTVGGTVGERVRIVTRRQLARIRTRSPNIRYVVKLPARADSVDSVFATSLEAAVGAGRYGWPAV